MHSDAVYHWLCEHERIVTASANRAEAAHLADVNNVALYLDYVEAKARAKEAMAIRMAVEDLTR